MSDLPATLCPMESSAGHPIESSAGHTVRTWSGRTCHLPITRDEFRSLLRFVEEMLAIRGCDNTLSHAQTWARAYGVPWARLARGLRGIGGFCDCEIGMNVVEEGSDEEDR